MKKYYLLLVLLSLPGLQINAQNKTSDNIEPCGLQEAHQLFLKENPDAISSLNKIQTDFLEDAKNFIESKELYKNDDSSNSPNYVIPVVFHVIYDCIDGEENVLDYRIHNALDRLNRDFQGQTYLDEPNTTFPVGTFDSIRFVLAQKDPEGNPSSGITRTQSSLSKEGVGFLNYDAATQQNISPLREIIQWPRNQYLNIYIAKTCYGASSGVSMYPSMSDNNPKFDGLCMSAWALDPPNPLEKTYDYILSHEVGHWLELRHIWSSDETNIYGPNSCNEDDFDFFDNSYAQDNSELGLSEFVNNNFNDTPNTVGHISYFNSYNTTNVCPSNTHSCSTADMYNNFMDYTPCANMFSEGQVHFMECVLNSDLSQRNQLYTPENLNHCLYLNTNSEIIEPPRVVFLNNNIYHDPVSNQTATNNYIPIKLAGNVSFVTTGLVSPNDYNVQIPTGSSISLVPELKIIQSDSAVLKIINVNNNGNITSVKDLLFSFNNNNLFSQSILNSNKSKKIDLYISDICSKITPNPHSNYYINSVEINNIVFQSSFNNSSYTDNTNSIIEIVQEDNFINIKTSPSNSNFQYWYIWIDVNQNNCFEENEIFFEYFNQQFSSIIAHLPIPPQSGQYKLRIGMNNIYTCGPSSNDIGEIEDYQIHVLNDNPYACKISEAYNANNPTSPNLPPLTQVETFITAQDRSIEANENVEFLAGEYILLTGVFEAKKNSIFEAKIEECSNIDISLFNTYPWLYEYVAPYNCCAAETISEYANGSHHYLFIEGDTNCGLYPGQLFYQDGAYACTNIYYDNPLQEDYICPEQYGLGNPINMWSCGSNTTTKKSIIEKQISSNLDFNIFPNPFEDIFNLKFEVVDLMPINIHIYSLDGRKIKTVIDNKAYNPGQYTEIIDGNDLSNGIYMLYFSSPTTQQTKKLIKF